MLACAKMFKPTRILLYISSTCILYGESSVKMSIYIGLKIADIGMKISSKTIKRILVLEKRYSNALTP